MPHRKGYNVRCASSWEFTDFSTAADAKDQGSTEERREAEPNSSELNIPVKCQGSLALDFIYAEMCAWLPVPN
jgi:hypothetical protein